MWRCSRTAGVLMLLAPLLVVPAGNANAQTAGLGLNPGRVEIELKPGQERTVGFTIDSPPSDVPVRGQLLLSLTDWNVTEDTSIVYSDAGSTQHSASPWVVFSPSALTISSGQKQLARVTVRVPLQTAPGLYRTAIFIQERPPATPPKSGEQLVYIRFRYAFFLYVIVPPVSVQPEVADLRLQVSPNGVRVICEMTNHGSRHVRPVLTLSIRNSKNEEIRSVRNYEATVLLPFSTNRETLPLNENLTPGEYEISAQVDFQDNGPLQSIRRTVDWRPPESAAPARSIAEN
jgi:hypothetical protein